MAATVKWATKADLEEKGMEVPCRMIALTGRNEAGEIIGIGGIAFLPDGQKFAFTDLTDEARKNPLALHKAALTILDAARRRGIKRIIAGADMAASPAAERWLVRLGFEKHEWNGTEVWLWRI